MIKKLSFNYPWASGLTLLNQFWLDSCSPVIRFWSHSTVWGGSWARTRHEDKCEDSARDKREIFRIVGWGGAAGVGNIPSIPRPASGQTPTREHPVIAAHWRRGLSLGIWLVELLQSTRPLTATIHNIGTGHRPNHRHREEVMRVSGNLDHFNLSPSSGFRSQTPRGMSRERVTDIGTEHGRRHK